jgi:hypothetical protein
MAIGPHWPVFDLRRIQLCEREKKKDNITRSLNSSTCWDWRLEFVRLNYFVQLWFLHWKSGTNYLIINERFNDLHTSSMYYINTRHDYAKRKQSYKNSIHVSETRNKYNISKITINAVYGFTYSLSWHELPKNEVDSGWHSEVSSMFSKFLEFSSFL